MDDTDKVLLITGINTDNDDEVKAIAGLAGYGCSVRRDEVTTAHIFLGTNYERREAGITDAEVFHMMSEFVRRGFTLVLTRK